MAAGVFVETSHLLAGGCLQLLQGRDISSCRGTHLAEAVEAKTGVPMDVQRLFLGRRLIKLDTLLRSQGVVGNSRVYLHIPIIGGQPATVRVTNIAKTLQQESLREEFQLFGRILHFDLIESRAEATNHCFVKYSSEKIAKEAIEEMDNEVLGGTRIRCDIAGAPRRDRTTVYPVWVGNIPRGSSEDDVMEVFSDYGNVVSVKIPSSAADKPFAFVNFYHQNGASGALSAHISMRGRRLYVKEKPPKVVTLSGRQIPGSQRAPPGPVTELINCGAPWIMVFMAKQITDTDDLFSVHIGKINTVSVSGGSDIAITGKRRYVRSVISDFRKVSDRIGSRVRTEVFTFPRHGDLFELLLPLYEDVKETLEKKNEQLYVFINDGAAANDSFTVELKTLDARLPAAESSRFKAIESRVAQCRHVMDAEEVKDLQAAMRQGQLTVSSLQASLTIQKTTVIVTSTSKEQADKTMATVKQFVQEFVVKKMIDFPTHGEIIVLARLSLFISMGQKYQPAVNVTATNNPVGCDNSYPAISLTGQRQHVNALVNEILPLQQDLLKHVQTAEVEVRSHGYLASILFREYTALKLLFEQDKAACILLPDESVFTALQPASSLLVTIESLDSDCVEARHMVCTIDESVSFVNFSVTNAEKASIESGMDDKRLDSMGSMACFVLNENTVTVSALSQAHAEHYSDVVKMFLHGEVIVLKPVHFPDVALEKLILKTRFKSLKDVIGQAMLEFSLKMASRTGADSRAELCVSGKRYLMDKGMPQVNTAVADLCRKFTRKQFSISDIKMTCLPACTDDIHNLPPECGLYYWSFTMPPLEEDVTDDDFAKDDGGKFEIELAREAAVAAQTTQTVVWSWKCGGEWKQHSKADCERINTAAQSGMSVKIDIGAEWHEVWPDANIQVSRSGGVAELRKQSVTVKKPSRTPNIVWQFIESSGSYRDYDRKQSLIIEKAAGEGKESVLLDMLHIVDFRKMEQINMKTKTTRKVRRVDMGPPPDRRDCMKPAIIGSQRRIVQSHSPLGVSLPKDVNVVVDNFSDSVFSAGDSEQEKMLKLLEFRLVTEKVPFPEEFSREVMVRLKNLSCIFLVSVSLFSHVKDGKNYISITGIAERVNRSLEFVNRWAYKALQQRRPEREPKPAPMLLYPCLWEEQLSDFEVKKVSAKTLEFQHMVGYLAESLPGASLKSLERIQNKALWKKYCQFKENIAEKLEVRLEEVVEARLFHCRLRSSRPQHQHHRYGFHGHQLGPTISLEEIYRGSEGFCMRDAGAGDWGEGIYYSPAAAYCDPHSQPTNFSVPGFWGATKYPANQILLAQVCVGEATRCQPDPGLRKPPQKQLNSERSVADKMHYDMVYGDKNGHQVFISYDDNQAYPLYLLTYTEQ